MNNGAARTGNGGVAVRPGQDKSRVRRQEPNVAPTPDQVKETNKERALQFKSAFGRLIALFGFIL